MGTDLPERNINPIGDANDTFISFIATAGSLSCKILIRWAHRLPLTVDYLRELGQLKTRLTYIEIRSRILLTLAVVKTVLSSSAHGTHRVRTSEHCDI